MNKNKITYHKKSGFGITEYYFDTFEARLFSTIELEEKSLKKKPSHGGMTVPEGYFEALEKKVIQKFTPAKNPKLISMRSIVNWASAAVLFLGVATYMFTQLPNASNQQQNLSLSDLSSESLENYIEESLFGSDLEYYLNGNANYDFAASLDTDINAEAYLNYIEDELLDEDF